MRRREKVCTRLRAEAVEEARADVDVQPSDEAGERGEEDEPDHLCGKCGKGRGEPDHKALPVF